MSITWETLVESLRAELEQYGGMVRLLEEQQECLIRRDATRLVVLAEQLVDVSETAATIRRRRELTVRTFALEHGHGAEITLRRLLPSLEIEVRPLVRALIDEVNRLIHRTRQMSRQNHAMFSRAVTLQQDFLRQLFPGRFTRTYSASGTVVPPAAVPGPAYHAAC